MGRAFLAGLIIAGLWSALLSSAYDGLANPLFLATQALNGGLLGVLAFLVASRFKQYGVFALLVALLLLIFFAKLVLVPLAGVLAQGFYFGELDFVVNESYAILFDPFYWEYRFLNYQHFLVPSVDQVVIALVVAAFVLRGTRVQEGAMTQGSKFVKTAPFAGLARRHDWSEINRLFLAHAWLGGSLFRRSVLKRAKESFDAPAPEIGVDMERLVKLCRKREARETGYRLVLLFFLIAALIGFVLAVEEENPALLVMVLLVLAIVHGFRRARLYRKTHRLYGLGNFSEDQPPEAEGVNLSEEQTRGLPPAEQNVVVYSGFTPFEFAGTAVGGWSVSIDTARPGSGVTAAKETKPFTEGELRSVITDGLRASRIEGLSLREVVLVQGTDAPALPAASSYKGIAQPRVKLDSEEIARLTGEKPNTFRRYVWISVRDWGGELLVSAFWRCALKDHMLQVELRHFVMTPLAGKYRKVDFMGRTWQHSSAQFMAGAILSPVALIVGPIMLLGQLQAGFARLIGSDMRARVNAIKINPRYNFGAPQSLRVQLMGDVFLHYFQKQDHEHYQRSLDKILLENLVSFLEDHGIDTADLKETQTAIFNSGVIVQGGDITAQSLAVGEKAKARTGIVGRALGRGGGSGGGKKAA